MAAAADGWSVLVVGTFSAGGGALLGEAPLLKASRATAAVPGEPSVDVLT